MMNRIFIVRSQLIFTLLIVMSCTPAKERKEGTVALENIELTTLNGEKINLADQQGKTVFINFWATWCRPCIQEMPSIAALQIQLAGKNIEFFFASDEEVDKIEKFMESRKMTLNFVRIENPESLGIQALPTTFIFDGEGNMIFSEVGLRKWDDPATIEMVTKLINEE
jgi:thiol-disulfide isomerase/thioredoxin